MADRRQVPGHRWTDSSALGTTVGAVRVLFGFAAGAVIGFAVAWAEEVTLDRVLDVEPRELIDRDDKALERMMAIAGNTKPSMLQDLEQGRPTEVDVVNGGVAQRARAHRIATPYNDRVVELVHAMERGERVPAPRELTELVAAARSDGDRPV